MMNQLEADVLVIGGGTGGCAAALAAAALGKRVIMTDENAWIGGQLTSQAVPPDEHAWIEQFGCTARYRGYRDAVRDYYRRHYPLTAEARARTNLNPGGGRVSRLCHEFRVGHSVLEAMFAAHESAGRVRIMRFTRPIAAAVEGDEVKAVTVRHLHTGEETTLTADYVLDATELGDLLPMTGTEYVSGAESRTDTGEMHAVDGPAQPDNVQAISWCFAMAHDPAPGANHVIEQPADYERWRDYVPALTPAWPGRMLDWSYTHPITLEPIERPIFAENGDFWHFRRVIDASLYAEADRPHEVTLVNWPQVDYIEGNLIDKPEAEQQRYLDEAKRQSLSMFYWMQTEAPRGDGGQGFPGLYLRPDITGTADGFAMYPYIRESRRLQAVFTVLEQHVGVQQRGVTAPEGGFTWPGVKAEPFDDSVGVGCYRIDLHPSTGGDNYIDVSSLPFQIPLGALLPVRMRNLLPACKNLGTTHITNGCYRLHPVEWNIGEAAGMLAAFCLEQGVEPRAVREQEARLWAFQALLAEQGVQLDWPFVRPV